MSIQEITAQLEEQLGKREAESTAKYIIEEIPTEALQKLPVNRVISGEPVQYITQASWFYGRKFKVKLWANCGITRIPKNIRPRT